MPLLLSGSSMSQLGGVLDFQVPSLHLRALDLTVPLTRSSAGHLLLDFAQLLADKGLEVPVYAMSDAGSQDTEHACEGREHDAETPDALHAWWHSGASAGSIEHVPYTHLQLPTNLRR